MNLKDILAKVAKGEALTEAEKAFLATVDPQRQVDEAAAAARRRAEERASQAETQLAELKRQLDAIQAEREAEQNKGRPEVELLKAEVEKLRRQLTERDAQLAETTKDRARLQRDTKLTAIIQKSGIDFVPKVDRAAMVTLLKGQFADLADVDLDVDGKVKPILDAFRAANEAIIADLSGHGAGGDPTRRMFQGKTISNPWKKETFNLTMQGRIATDDPELARRLKAEVGIAA